MEVERHKRSRKPGQAGFTLVELLVVIGLLALGMVIVIENLNTVMRQYEIDGAATGLSRFLESTPNWAKDQNTAVFLIWNPSADTIQIALDVGGTTVLDEHELPDNIVVTPTSAVTLRCDTVGRTFPSTSNVMLTTPMVIAVNHEAMIAGRVSPQIEFNLSISPLWHVSVERNKI